MTGPGLWRVDQPGYEGWAVTLDDYRKLERAAVKVLEITDRPDLYDAEEFTAALHDLREVLP